MPTRAQRGCRIITPPILDSGARRRWAPPRLSRFSSGMRPHTHCVGHFGPTRSSLKHLFVETFETRKSLLALAEKCRDRIPGQFSGAFAKLRKATISFVMSVCLSLRPSGRLSVHPRETSPLQLNEIRCSGIFRKSVTKIQISLKSAKNNWSIIENKYIYSHTHTHTRSNCTKFDVLVFFENLLPKFKFH